MTAGTTTSALKDAARGRWLEILSALGGIPTDVLDGKHHPCPKCGGVDRFRMIDREAGALFCNQCFASKNGDGVAALEWLTGEPFKVVLAKLTSYLGIDGRNSNGQAVDVVAEMARRKGVTAESLKRFGAHAAKRSNLMVCRLPMYEADMQKVGDFDMGPGALEKG